MTPKALRQLILGGKTLELEFKGESARPLSDAEFVEAIVCLANRPISLDDLLLLNHLCRERRLTSTEGARVTQEPEAETRARLQRLVEAGVVESRGERKGRSWLLSAGTYRRLGGKAAYVRQRGFEPLQQEQMILQYIEKHGSISRAEVAELCQVSLPQAYRVLQHLVKTHLIIQDGRRGQGVRYRLHAV